MIRNPGGSKMPPAFKAGKKAGKPPAKAGGNPFAKKSPPVGAAPAAAPAALKAGKAPNPFVKRARFF